MPFCLPPVTCTWQEVWLKAYKVVIQKRGSQAMSLAVLLACIRYMLQNCLLDSVLMACYRV